MHFYHTECTHSFDNDIIIRFPCTKIIKRGHFENVNTLLTSADTLSKSCRSDFRMMV